ncbi:MAG: beta-propeller domain-containing protein, partial [Patescibacteria group bacterium]
MFKPAYLMGVIAAAIVGALFAQTPPSPLPNPAPVPAPSTQIKERLPKFQSCQDLRGKLQQISKSTLGDYRLDSMESSQAREFSPSTLPNYSPTNVQVEGVDEGDLVKTDGRFIYTFSDQHLTITAATPPRDAAVISSTDLEGLQPREMFLNGERLIILGERSRPVPQPWSPSRSLRMDWIEPAMLPSQPLAIAELWDVSDRANPERIRMTAWTGSLITARATKGFAYLAIQTQVNPNEQELVPMFRDQIQDVEDLESDREFQPVATCKDISYVDPIQSATFVTVASLSFDHPSRALDQSVVLARGDMVYASPQHLYLAVTSYGDWSDNSGPTTTLVKFSFDRGRVRARGAAHVAGRTLNQFSMDERDGVFRIVTTREPHNGRDARATDLYLLDDNLERLGSVENIAPGEQFYAARFFGDRAYLVTFQVTDPLFVVDLSDPKNPKILGELEIPGYSTYLQPYDETHLIG